MKNLFKFGRLKSHGANGKVQVEQLTGEIHSDLDHPQEHGFASKAPTESSTWSAYRDGNQESGAVLIIGGSAPINIAEGDTVVYSAGGATVHCTGGKIELNGDSFGGLIAINDLTTKLNLLISQFDAHVHSGISPGMSSTMVPSLPATAFLATDYENPDVEHG